MKIRTVQVGSIGENTYILSDDKQTVLIDPGADCDIIEAALEGKPCRHVLLTHAHYDHIGAVAYFAKKGAKVYLHENDLPLLHGNGNLAALFGEKLEKFEPDAILHDGDRLDFFDLPIIVIHTPGHTEGSVCYVAGNAIFSGDTLFYLSVGRTDFPSGDGVKLRSSLGRLFALSGDFTVYPGHDRATSLTFEKENNPYA